MFTRILIPALFAASLLAGTAAWAATGNARHHSTHRNMHAAHATRMSSKSMHRTNQGGDAQNGAVDQLNAQSLQRAQGQ
ncbi:MAG: hypothetical protein M3Y41_10355 [Pseudomonadota bacterium]|nr:hypothetical protein [Pseudomonadota bacterium]